ncbi:MAG: class I SAM-dependent methyltransferase [Syntrophothermus sp.]
MNEVVQKDLWPALTEARTAISNGAPYRTVMQMMTPVLRLCSEDEREAVLGLVDLVTRDFASARRRLLRFSPRLLGEGGHDRACDLKSWYSDLAVQQLYAAFASCAILSSLREAYVSFVRENLRPREDLVLLELGVGPGHQLAHLLSSAVDWPLHSLTIIGVDLSAPLLAEAEERVQKHGGRFRYPMQFHAIQASFENLSISDLPAKPDLVASTLALHHLPYTAKQRFLGEVARWGSRALFLGEVDALLDRLPFGSGELITRAIDLYESVFRAVIEESGLSRVVAEQVNQSFFEPELWKVVACPYAQRGEYFLPAEEWRRLLQVAGFFMATSRPVYSSKDGKYRLTAVTAVGKPTVV